MSNRTVSDIGEFRIIFLRGNRRLRFLSYTQRMTNLSGKQILATQINENGVYNAMLYL